LSLRWWTFLKFRPLLEFALFALESLLQFLINLSLFLPCFLSSFLGGHRGLGPDSGNDAGHFAPSFLEVWILVPHCARHLLRGVGAKTLFMFCFAQGRLHRCRCIATSIKA